MRKWRGSLSNSRFKEFMRPFRGPGTRHLPLYIGWMLLRDQPDLETDGRPLLEHVMRYGRHADLTLRILGDDLGIAIDSLPISAAPQVRSRPNEVFRSD